MDVGIVAAELEGEATGVGRYLAGLLRGLARVAPPEWRFHLFFWSQPALPDGLPPSRFQVHCADGGWRPKRLIVWEQVVLPRLLRGVSLDLLFSPSYSLPRASVPAMVTVHDLAFEVCPGEFGLRQRWRRRLLARHACRRARRVLVDRPAMRDQLADVYGLSSDKLGVVPIAVEEGFTPREGAQDASMLEELGLAADSVYALFVGSLFERRSPRLMLDTVVALRRWVPDLRLVIAGSNRLREPSSLTAAIRSLDLERVVLRLGYVSEAALPALYRRAAMTLYLSPYEGYGIPPLESLACGTPCLVGPGMALDDWWPGYPLRVAEMELEGVLQAARRALDRERREQIAREAARRLSQLTWEWSAAQFLREAERALASEGEEAPT